MAILAFSAEARALVVAEGIEDERMFGLVKEVTHAAVKGTPGLIHGVQGYLFGRPAAAENLAGEPPDALAA
jgi:EAL domain-containing protein (putative c-di-GMP-specific phosphodiesterase class I)